MILKIYDFKKVSELQDKFNECFPAYKIEFYPSVRSMKAGHAAEPDCLVQNLTKKHDNGELEILSTDSVEDVYGQLKKKFGLQATIFRFENSRYIPADMHDHLTNTTSKTC